MKGIGKRLTALLLSCAVFAVSVLGRCQPVSATAIAGPATAAGIAAGETLEFIYSALMSVGITLNLKELFNNRFDPDNWDWGDVLDDPASQGQIDALDKKIGEYYDNAVKDWYVNHGGNVTPSPEPTKTPGTDPVPVTPAPTSVPPDIGEKIDSWREMREKALQKKVLTMTAVAGACLKEAVTGWWDNIMDKAPDAKKTLTVEEVVLIQSSGCVYYEAGTHRYDRMLNLFGAGSFIYGSSNNYSLVARGGYKNYVNGELRDSGNGYSGGSVLGNYNYDQETVVSTLPIFASYDDGDKWSKKQTLDNTEKIPSKNIILPIPSLKKLLDDNKKSPDLPMPISITLPNLDEIKDLVNDTDKADDEDKPTVVQTFINNHTYNEPEPTQSPDPDPNPTGSPSTDPDPTGAPETTPSVTPAAPGDIDIKPKPTTTPGTGTGTGTDGGGGGTGTDPDKPDSDNTNLDDYKTDLRLVFPFCIPFDLIHLLNVLDAEPEAPRFEIPVDIEVDNPFPRARSEGKMIDYETTIVIDMSDYEEPIKVIRIFEIIFFIIGLMLITRQHMIKG